MNLFYIEEKDRPAGIGVQWTTPVFPCAQNDTVTVFGKTALLNNAELTIVPIEVIKGPAWLPFLTPVGMRNNWTGGGQFGQQPAVIGQDTWLAVPKESVGLSNVGLLVRTWGRVTWHAWPYATPTTNFPTFWINDGSDLHDGFWTGGWPPAGMPITGVACLWIVGHPLSFPDIDEYWGVTGILRAIPNWGAGAPPYGPPVRLLVPRSFPEDANQFIEGP